MHLSKMPIVLPKLQKNLSSFKGQLTGKFLFTAFQNILNSCSSSLWLLPNKHPLIWTSSQSSVEASRQISRHPQRQKTLEKGQNVKLRKTSTGGSWRSGYYLLSIKKIKLFKKLIKLWPRPPWTGGRWRRGSRRRLRQRFAHRWPCYYYYICIFLLLWFY